MSPNRTHIKYLDNIALKSFIKQNTFMSVCVLGSEFSVNTHDRKFVIKKNISNSIYVPIMHVHYLNYL